MNAVIKLRIMPNKINSVQNASELQNIVGEPHDIIKAKVLNQLDRHCLTFLKQSPIVFFGYWHKGVSKILILNGNSGFIKVLSHTEVYIPYHQEFSLIESAVADEFLPVAMYFWIPGIGETLRINGVVKWLVANKSNKLHGLHIAVEEAFLHCAKSILRSKLWKEKEYPDIKIDYDNNCTEWIGEDCKTFIKSSPFYCLHTQDDSKKTELSPRGDPPNTIYIIDKEHLLIPDRPGNKRVDSMHNLLRNPLLGILFLIPGIDLILKINGRARVISDAQLLQLLTVKKHIPKLGILVTVTQCRFRKTNSLNWQKIWKQAIEVDKNQFPTLGQVLVEQATKSRSLVTKIKGKVVEEIIKRDYKKNLY